MFLLYIIILAIALVIQYFIAKQFESVAADKGYIGSRFFHLSFWLGLPGWLLVVSLPDRNFGKIKIINNNNISSSEASNSTEFVETNQDCTWSNGKCELCAKDSDHITYCEIVDNLGTRYRNICSGCIAKHNATPKKK